MDNDTKKSLVIICIVGIAIGWLIWCGIHGYWMDMVEGRMHDNCVKCDTYRYMHSNNAAFQIREINRN